MTKMENEETLEENPPQETPEEPTEGEEIQPWTGTYVGMKYVNGIAVGPV